LNSLVGISHAVAGVVENFTDALPTPIGWLFLVLLIRLLVRNQWLAAVVAASSFALVFVVEGSYPLLFYFFIFVAFLAYGLVLVRFGLIVGLFGMAYMYIGSSVVLTADPSSWYAGRSLFALLVMAGIAVYAFYISLAGRQLYKGDALER
jgi:hypothetical protein